MRDTMLRIPLTQGKFAVIDECDAHLAAYDWHAMKGHKTWYAVRFTHGKNRVKVYLHREVAQVPAGVNLDHKNANGLDCRRRNLRVATKSQNTANADKPRTNTSGYKGACWDKRRSKWIATIGVNGKKHYLGSYATREEAACQYDDAALLFFGPFAKLNFPVLTRRSRRPQGAMRGLPLCPRNPPPIERASEARRGL